MRNFFENDREEEPEPVEEDPMGLTTEYVWKDILKHPDPEVIGKHRKSQHEILQKEEE